MDKNGNNILIVAPYTKRYGVAVFDDTDLIYFSVRTYFPNTGLPNEIAKIIEEFVPNSIIVKKLTSRQANAELQHRTLILLGRIARAREIPVTEAIFEDVKKELTKMGGARTKKNAFTAVTRMFPELSKIATFQNPSQKEYYTPVLSAVAIGLVHWPLHRARSMPN